MMHLKCITEITAAIWGKCKITKHLEAGMQLFYSSLAICEQHILGHASITVTGQHSYKLHLFCD